MNVIEAKLNDLTDMMRQFDIKLDTVQDTMLKHVMEIRSEFGSQLVSLESNVKAAFECTNGGLRDAQLGIDAMEKQLIRNDVVILGVPFSKGENLIDIFIKMFIKTVSSQTATPVLSSCNRIRTESYVYWQLH